MCACVCVTVWYDNGRLTALSDYVSEDEGCRQTAQAAGTALQVVVQTRLSRGERERRALGRGRVDDVVVKRLRSCRERC